MGKCYNSAVLNAPLERVWQTVRKFHDFSWASGVIASCETVAEQGSDTVGAKRVLNGLF